MPQLEFREELGNRVSRLQKQIDEFKAERDKIEQKLRDAEAELQVWQTAYQMESERLGEPGLPLFGKEGKSYRFAGMRLADALATLRQEQPEITKRQAADILKAQGFNFGSKKPNRVVHFAWVALDRRKK